MNLSRKLVIAATLVDKITEKGVTVGVCSAYHGMDEVGLIVHGDEVSMYAVTEVLDTATALDRVGDIKAPCLQISGTFDGVNFVVTSTPQKETS